LLTIHSVACSTHTYHILVRCSHASIF
jgi:hypothetical protein